MPRHAHKLQHYGILSTGRVAVRLLRRSLRVDEDRVDEPRGASHRAERDVRVPVALRLRHAHVGELCHEPAAAAAAAAAYAKIVRAVGSDL